MMNGERILILDPFKNLLNIYQMFLGLQRYHVETASYLKEASRKLREERFAALITEFLPPFEETFQMIGQVKGQSPETYIIIVTNATVDEGTYEKLFDLGVDDIIIKPHSPVKILAHVRKGLRIRDLIIKDQELERGILTDPVSSEAKHPVFNLTHFRRCLRQELKRAMRHAHPLSLLLVEIPTEGEKARMLDGFSVEVIMLLRNNTREEDIVGRENGGFGVVLPETDEPGSQALVRRLLKLIQDHPRCQSDADLRSIAQAISFRPFTYPDRFVLPERLRLAIGDLPLA